MPTLLRACVAWTLYLISFAAVSGSQQATKVQFEPEQIRQFAKAVERAAADESAHAFIIARLGQPQDALPKGIQFTHTAVAVYSSITLADGRKVPGYAIYNLYQDNDDPDRSSLIMDYPVDFFWGVHQLKAGILVPTPELQQRLIQAIANGDNRRVHNPKYSLIANPFNNKYQNCTEHTLNLINAAIYQTTNMKQLKTFAQAHFEPTRVKINRLKLTLGGLFMEGVHSSDQKGKIVTATFGSLADYLENNGLVQSAFVMTPETRTSLVH